MGFFVILFIVCFFVFVFFIFKAKPENNVQQNMAATMSGSIPVVNNQPGPSDEDVLANAKRLLALTEAATQAKESGHDDVYQAIMANTYDGPLPERRADGGWTSIFDDLRILSIAGINHRQNVGRYTGRNTVAVVPEPKNEFDPGALKVIAEDGHHLGYISRDHQEMVRSWCHERWPYYCEAVINDAHEDDGTIFYVGYLYMIKQ